MKFTAASALALAALIPASVAQTFTKCNPLEKKGCPDMEALGANATFNWNKTGIPSNDKVWTKPNQGKISWVEKGATFTIERSGDAPQVDSKFYMLFGRLEVIMKTASGQGIVSTAILQSETLDEIDWEFLGGNTTHVFTNFYGKGNNETLHGEDIPTDKAPQDNFRNYTVDWTKERIQWWLDDKMIREVVPADAQNGKFYPQTPMNIRIGCWAAGDKDKNSKGTIEWAQGETDFSKGPFTMTVQHVYAQDYTTGAQMYSWDNMDASGTWDNVKVEMGKSEVLKEIQSPSGVRNRWAALPQAAKIGIIAGAAGAFILLLLFIGFCCIKQRRAGKKEHAALLAEEQREAAELQEYKRQMQSGKFGFGSNTYRV